MENIFISYSSSNNEIYDVPVFVDKLPNMEFLVEQAYQISDRSNADTKELLKTLESIQMYRIDSSDMDGSIEKLISDLKFWDKKE